METKAMWVSYSKLHELECIEDGNKLPNLKEFVKNNCQNWEYFIQFCNEEGIDEDMFWYIIGTLLICAKNNYSSNFGKQFMGMVAVTYKNFSYPNLLEFYLIKK